MSWLTIDSGHDESDLCSISSTCEMGVDLLRLRLIQRNKTIQDVVARSSIVIATYIIS